MWSGGKTRQAVIAKITDKVLDQLNTKILNVDQRVNENTFKGSIEVDRTDSSANIKTYNISEETMFENYETLVSGNTILNTYVSPKTTLEKEVRLPIELIEKLKETGSITQIEVVVVREDKGGTKESRGETILVPISEFDDNGVAKIIIDNVDQNDFDGDPYKYSIDVLTDIPGYDKKKMNLVMYTTKYQMRV